MLCAGSYYAHCTALDDCMGSLCATLDEIGLTENTLLVFFSDHGDMLGSQGQIRKQRPFGAREQKSELFQKSRWLTVCSWLPCALRANMLRSIRGGDSRSLLDLVSRAGAEAEAAFSTI